MKRFIKTALAVCLVAAVSFPSYGTQSDINDAKKRMDSLEQEKEKVEQTLKGLEGLKQDAALYVKQLDASVAELNTELEGLAGMISDKEADIASALLELEAAKDTEKRQYESMKLRIKYMYEKGDTSYLDILLGSESFAQLYNRAEYIAGIARYDRKMLEVYAQSKAVAADKEEALQKEHAGLLELQAQAEAKRESEERLLSEKSAELKNFEGKIASAEGQLSEYEADMKAQENQIRQIEADIKRKEEEARKAALAAGQKYNTVSIGNINFIWPCPAGRGITSNFGDRESPTEGASTNHQGIDVGAASGSSILAAAAGEVIISTYSYSAGNYIMVNHGGGVSTVYMHCSQLLASVGDKVEQGQIIAKVGSTGYSTGPHLHFGVRVNGSYVNPIKYVSP